MKSKSMTPPLEPAPLLPKPWEPHDYQLRAVQWGIEHAAGMFLLRPGAGKTAIILALTKILKKARTGCKKVLLLAPIRVCDLVWPQEAKKWVDFNGVRIVNLHGDHKEELLKEPADIYMLNYEGLAWLTGAVVKKLPKGRVQVTIDKARIKAMGFDTLVVDELSKFKNTHTSRFAIMKQIVGGFGRRWGLTGSPSTNGLVNLFGEAYVIDEGRTFGPYVTHFHNEFFVPDASGFGWNLQKGAETRIYKALKPLAFLLNPKEYTKLPTLAENIITVELPPDVLKIYKELERNLYARIENEEITASNMGVASGKCRQVASGGIYLEPELMGLLKPPKSAREWFNLHTAKIDALEDLIDELEGKPLLVAYDFEHDLDRLKQRFGKDLPYIGSGVSKKRAADLESLWNRGKLPFLFGHPQSIGHGLNLQEGSAADVCWHTLIYDYDLWDQFIRRVLRQGNKSARVTNHIIVAAGTLDLDALYALKRKENVQEALFKGLRRRYKAAN